MNQYKTSDLWFASVLLELGFKIVSIEGEVPHKVVTFEIDPATRKQITSDYWEDRLDVNARTLLLSSVKLKSRVYGRE